LKQRDPDFGEFVLHLWRERIQDAAKRAVEQIAAGDTQLAYTADCGTTWIARRAVLCICIFAFSGFALLLAGTLRAEATLAGANLIYVVLLGVGGVVFPLTKFPRGARPLLELLPTGALSTGLRDVLAGGAAFPVKDAATLAIWAVAGITLAARFFRWE